MMNIQPETMIAAAALVFVAIVAMNFKALVMVAVKAVAAFAMLMVFVLVINAVLDLTPLTTSIGALLGAFAAYPLVKLGGLK